MLTPTAPRVRHPLALRLQCRAEWVGGQGTLAEVAFRRGVPAQTVVSWYRRENWSEARKRWLDKQRCDSGASAQHLNSASIHEGSADDNHARKIARLEEQLESLDIALEAARTPDDWHKLSTAKQKLFDQWRILRGIPLPGSRKPPAEMPKQEEPCFDPVD